MSPENRSITFSPRRISKGLQRVGFADELIPVMTAIALAESSGLLYAHNKNKFTGDDSYGLFQINMIDDIGVERRRLLSLSSNDDLFNPRKNFEAAKFIFDQQGLNAWGAYRNGSYRDYLASLITDEAYLKNVKGIFVIISKKLISIENTKLNINEFTELANKIAIRNTIESL